MTWIAGSRYGGRKITPGFPSINGQLRFSCSSTGGTRSDVTTRCCFMLRPWGLKTKRVGKRAGYILRMASALASGEELLIQRPDVPEHPNYVMFDLEGLPPANPRCRPLQTGSAHSPNPRR